MNNNIDISKILEALSKMPKKDLEAGIAKANQILKSKSGNPNQINKNKF